MNENPEEPEGCADAVGAVGFAPKVKTPGLFGKLKLEVLLPNWNTGPGKVGWKQKRTRKLSFEFILSILVFLLLYLTDVSLNSLKMTKFRVGGRFTRNARLQQEQCFEKIIHFSRES